MDSEGTAISGPGSWFGALERVGRMFSADPARTASAPTASASAPRILIAEDNPSLRVLTCRVLTDLGIAPALAVDGAEAVTLACARPFDLILMDLQMPVLDGLAATLKIRRFEQEHAWPRVPVVAYTACPYSDNEPFLLDFGIDALLIKPSTAWALQDCLLKWVPAGCVVGNLRAAGRGLPAQPV